MLNISMDGRDIAILKGKYYFIIDALYLNKVREELSDVVEADIEQWIRYNLFPYMETPFAIFLSNSLRVQIKQIRNCDEDNIKSNCFSTDTGLLVFIERSIFVEFSKRFEFNRLVESNSEIINQEYWNELQNDFDVHTCGLVLAPGLNSGFDFVGSGLYEFQT